MKQNQKINWTVAPQHFCIWLKVTAFILSTLLLFYAVPANIYADLIDTIEDVIEDSVTSKSQEETITPQEDIDSEDVQQVDALWEETDRREESVKHFRLSDGSYTAVQYNMPIHEKDESGIWQDIDNTLSSKGSEYSTPNAKIKFAKKITDNETLFTLHDGNRKITMSLVGAKKKVEGQVTNTQTDFDEDATQLQKMMTLDKLSSKILYPDILDGVDLEYVVQSSNIKENIIVKAKADVYAYTFEIKLNQLEATLCEDGSVAIADPDTNEVVYTIPKGFMYDANGAYSDDVTYTLQSQGNGIYTLTVIADADWINAEERAFPVTVDPPINATSSASGVVDTYIDSANPSSLYYNFSYLACGTGSNGQEFISYWKATTLPSLPKSAYIVSAEFSLYCQDHRLHEGTTTDLKLGLYQVTSHWTTSITWNKYDSGTMGSFSQNELIDYQNLNDLSENQYISWDITRLYRSWHSDATSNHGIALVRLSDTNANATKTDALVASSEVSNAPRLMVDYRVAKGVESYWSGSSHSAGLAGNGYIDHATGNLVFSIGTLNTGDSLFAFTPTLVYNSAVANQFNTYTHNPNVHYKYILAGYGFKLNTNESIVERTCTDENGNTQTFYVWSDGDGTEHYFLQDKVTQEWKDEDGLGLTLTVTNSNYWIEDQNHNKRRFTNSSNTADIYAGGILEHIQDKYGNKLRFNYNSKGQTTNIDIVPSGHSTDNAIQYLTFSYNSVNSLYRVQNVVTGQVVTFEYSTSLADTSSPSALYGGALAKVSYGHMEDSTLVTDATMLYTYTNTAADGIYRLASAKDNTSSTEIRYTYDTAGRVQTVSEYANNTMGQSMSFVYGTGYTEVRNSGNDDVLHTDDDIITRYSMDYQGRTVSVYSTNVSGTTIYGASNGSYNNEENHAAKNSLKASGVVNGVSVNYIQNGGFSDGVSGWENISQSDIANWYIGYDGAYRHDKSLGVSFTASLQKEIRQYVRIPNGTYTLSAQLSCLGGDNHVTVRLRVESMEESNHVYQTTYAARAEQGEQSSHAPTLSFTADGGSDGYENYKVIISVESDVLCSGTVFVDDVMLGNNLGASTYNMIQYGAFDETTINSNAITQPRVPSHWALEDDTIAYYQTSGGIGDSGALKIVGDLDEYQRVYQIIPVTTFSSQDIPNRPRARTFTVSGFAKGSHQVANQYAYFGFDIWVNYADGSNDTFYFDFNKELTDWQFLSGTFTTGHDKIVESIEVYCLYASQPGTAYFDNISLVEETGNNAARYAYTENGLLEFVYTPSLSEYYEYDADNQLTTFYNSKGYGTAYVYGTNHTLLSQTDFRYSDPNFDLLTWYFKEQNPDEEWPQTTTATSKTEYTINQYGFNTQTVSYAASDDKDNATQATATKQLVSSSTYQLTTGSKLFGKVLTATDTSGNMIAYTYNTKGQLTHERYADNNGLYYEYDVLGRMTNVYPLMYYMSIDLLYYPFVVTTAEKAVYTYNPDHSLDTITTTSTVYSFVYDDFGNTTAIMVGEGDTAVALATYTYAPNNGKLMSMTYGNGKVMTYTYDDLDRVSEICYTDSSNTQQYYRYTYTAEGLVHTVESTEAGRMYCYTYNTKGQPIGTTELTRTGYAEDGTPIYANALQSNYWYDGKDRIEYVQNHMFYLVGTEQYHDLVEYEYFYDDKNGQAQDVLSEFDVSGVGGATANYTYTYDALYRPTQKNLSTNGGYAQNISYTYRNQSTSTTTGQISQSTSKVGNATDGILSQTTYTYEYDKRGNITKITDSDGNITRYTYDDLGQLTREDNPYLNKSYTYTYDTAGNRTSKNTYAYTTGTLGTATATQTLAYTDGAWGDQLSNTTYDAVGNPLTYNGNTLTWQGRQLMRVYGSAGMYDYSFTYNDEGIRTTKNVNGIIHYYTLEGSQIVSEQWGTHLLIFLYDESGSPIGLQYRSTSYAEGVFDTYYFEKNLFGDIVAIYADDGTKIGSYKYDAWGNVTSTTISGTTTLQKQIVRQYNPFRYRGYYYDTQTSLYYLQSRYYDPATGRFINADGYINANGDLIGYNMYAYCSNNPVMYVDPTGEWSWKAFGESLLIGAAVVAVTTVAISLVFAAPAALIGTIVLGALGAVIMSSGAIAAEKQEYEHINTHDAINIATDAFLGTVQSAIGALNPVSKILRAVQKVTTGVIIPTISAFTNVTDEEMDFVYYQKEMFTEHFPQFVYTLAKNYFLEGLK